MYRSGFDVRTIRGEEVSHIGDKQSADAMPVLGAAQPAEAPQLVDDTQSANTTHTADATQLANTTPTADATQVADAIKLADATQLVDGLRRGDEHATRFFVETYYDPLLRYLFRLVQDHQGAEDVCQELFIRAIQRIDQVRDPKGFKTWLYRIATNLAHDYLRCRKDTPVPEVLPESVSTDDVEQLRERLYVAQTLGILSSEHREVLLLRFYEDMSLQEISEVLEIPLGTVKSRLHHALRQLRRHLEYEEQQEQEVLPHGVQRSRAYPSHVV